MTFKEKYGKLRQHVENHPHDYQSQIALYKLNSEQIAWEIEQARHERRKKVAECKRLYAKQQIEQDG